MASISSVGVGSGVLNNDLIDDLIQAERSAVDQRLEADETELTTKISELGNVRSAVSGLEAAIGSLTLASSFETNTTSSSDDNTLTATASSLANPGVYDVETLELARAQSIASKSYDSLNDVVGQGNLVFSFGEISTTLNADKSVGSFDGFVEDDSKTSKTITINSGNHTLAGVRDAVNAAEIGIVASIVDTGDGFRLLFESEDTGVNNGFTIEADGATNGLDDFNFNASDSDQVLHTTDALDARLKVNGLEVTRESNTVTGVINGVTLNLRQTSVGEPVSLTVEPDMETINKRMQDFVTAYNELKSLTTSLTAYDLDEQQGSVFTGDSTIRNLDSQLKRILSDSLPVTANGSINSLAEIGISTNAKTGLISFDSAAFSALAKSDPEALTKLFGTTGIDAENVEYIRGNNQTKSGDYDIVVSSLATQGVMEGNATSGGTYIINALNDDFKINVDGVTSEAIELSQGSYTGSELASLLESQINGDEKFKANAKSVTVKFDSTDNSFNFTSSSYGSNSSVSFSSIESNMADELGLYRPGQGPRELDAVSALSGSTELANAFAINDSNDNFDITVAGVTTAVSIAQGTYNDGADLAAAIQSAINGSSELSPKGISSTVTYTGEQDGGQFDISFNNNESYLIGTADPGLSDLGIGSNLASTQKATLLASSDTFQTPLVVDDTNNTFSLVVDGDSFDDISFTEGTYLTGTDYATSVQSAINAQTTIPKPAVTSAGSVDLSTPIDFSAANRSFTVAVDGAAAVEVVVNQNATTDLNGDSTVDENDNLKAVQDAIDSAVGAGQLTASFEDSKLVLTSTSTGDAATIDVQADGRVASTATGTIDTSTFDDLTDFAAATIDFDLNGTALSVDLSSVTVPATGPATLLEDIQTQVNAALEAQSLTAGDIVVKQDASNGIYFEGINAADGQSLSISAVSANNVLGVSTTGHTAGLDGLGLAQTNSSGADGKIATVSYVGGNEGGGLKIDFGNSSRFTISEVEEGMGSSVGIAASDGSQNLVTKGKDVVGTINGIAAVGSGQRLTGAEDTDSYGLALRITGDAIGTRGTVNFNLGLAEQTQRFLQEVLGSGGSLSEKESGFQASLSRVSEDKAELDTRMESKRASLSRQFTYYDTIVAQLNSTIDFIKANFEALNASNN